MMWAAGAVAAMSSITFPAISAIVSRNADPDQQGKLSNKSLFHKPKAKSSWFIPECVFIHWVSRFL